MADDSVVCRNETTDDSSSEEDDEEEEETDPRSQLRSLILANSTLSAFDKTPHRFVPEGVIENMMTEDVIRSCLEINQPSKKADEIVEFIKSRAKKTFAIAVLTWSKDIMTVMRSLKKKKIDDSKLPIKDEGVLGSKVFASEFFHNQWRFVAPIFSTDAPNHDLEASHILPFVSKNSESGRGSFGVVSQYFVHGNHLLPVSSENTTLAVKEIQATEDAQEVATHWENEARALRTMNQLNQKHIVRFITAFRRRMEHCREEHYLMFEWADGGNLCDLWKRMPTPILTAPLIKAIIKQILGLAKALEAAHNLNTTGSSYRHGDIKPENILIFGSEGSIGTFKIGDWGEARGHTKATEMRPSKTAAKYGTLRYEAPEVVTGVESATLGTITKRRSRLYDIWAMGCITLELLIWLLYGESKVMTFHNELGHDSFYEIINKNGKNEAKVHHVVTSWMERMADDPRCRVGTTAVGNILEIVRTGLLVVKLPPRLGQTMLSLPQRNRTDSALIIPNEDTNIISRGPIGEGGAIADVTKPAADLPSFIFSPAEPEHSEAPVQFQAAAGGPFRLLSDGFCQRLEEIDAEDEDESYWCLQESHLSMSKRSSLSYSASVPPTTDHGLIERNSSAYPRASEPDSHSLAAPNQPRVNYASPELDENDWRYQSGNSLALSLAASLKNMNMLGSTNHEATSRLCARCVEFQDQILIPGFSVSYDVQELETSELANACDLCSLLWDAVVRHGGATSPTITFDRNGPFLRIGGSGHPVLSVVRDLEQQFAPTTDVQLGFVILPNAGSTVHGEVFKHWLTNCDQNHKCAPLHHTKRYSKPRLPTRLLDLGVKEDDVIRLWATGAEDTGEWVALSHQWGSKHFSTTLETLQAHISGIDLSSLPATFRDAITVTRALGRRYLWIDSLCIIQGPESDFMTEAKRMEEVYSGAYCVIAASCATDHYSGFLKPRYRRKHVGLCREDKDQEPFYVCQNIDDFKSQVLDGDLHARGWVLQEHALARRTLFFTENQTYFECGEGVHCETSTLLTNKLAAFLGDPEFPHILSNASQGERILRYQELYRKYSRLGLSKPYDRPAAIDGLQQRLLRTMRVNGGFGVFDEGVTRGLLRRSLLWRRGADTGRLTRIHFPTESVVSTVPSWSWMAYTGGIDYLQPEFGSFEWEDLQSPWSPNSPQNISNTDFSTVNVALIATARQYDLGAAVLGEGELIFDTPNRSSMPKTLCVVLGKARGTLSSEMKRHYVLIIAIAGHGGRAGETVYERVGAGHLPGKCISPTGISVRIH